MNRLSTESRSRVLACLCEGVSQRATVRLTGVAKGTVAKLSMELGEACERFGYCVTCIMIIRNTQTADIQSVGPDTFPSVSRNRFSHNAENRFCSYGKTKRSNSSECAPSRLEATAFRREHKFSGLCPLHITGGGDVSGSCVTVELNVALSHGKVAPAFAKVVPISASVSPVFNNQVSRLQSVHVIQHVLSMDIGELLVQKAGGDGRSVKRQPPNDVLLCFIEVWRIKDLNFRPKPCYFGLLLRMSSGGIGNQFGLVPRQLNIFLFPVSRRGDQKIPLCSKCCQIRLIGLRHPTFHGFAATKQAPPRPFRQKDCHQEDERCQ